MTRSPGTARRTTRIAGPLWAGALVAALIAAVAIAVFATSEGDGGETGGPFGQHFQGLEQRRLAADVPTMGDGGSVHLHAALSLYANGERIGVPANIGIDPARPPEEMAGLHTHDDSGLLHVEAGDDATLGQFFRVWGVPLSSRRLGPYRVDGGKPLRMWVDGRPSRAFGNLALADGQEIVVAYGARPSP